MNNKKKRRDKMKIKRIFSSVMALGLVVTLAACGGNDSETGGSAGTTSTEGSQAGMEESVDDFQSQTSDDTLVIGVDSIGGDFIQGFANSGNDVKIRQLMGIQGNLGY